MFHNEESPLEQIMALTKMMEDKALDQAWDDLIVLEQQRLVLIEANFPINHPSSSQAEMLQSIINLNSNIEMLCRSAKNDIQSELAKLTSNKTAIKAYQKN